MSRVALIGPVYPYRAGIAHCTTRLAQELGKRFELTLVSFSRQFPRALYPGDSDVDETLRKRKPENARFALDILNPFTWLRLGFRLRRERMDVVIFVWWIWVWAIPYLVVLALLPRRARVILQCHNVSDKEPAWWKSLLTNAVLRRAGHLIVHAATDADEVRRRIGDSVRVTRTFLPVHEMGDVIPSREVARSWLDIEARNLALFFGHVRPFKGLDVALRAWSEMRQDVLLLVAGEFWDDEDKYRGLVGELELAPRVRFEPRFIPDAEIADYFAAADVVIAPYLSEAQSGVVLTAFHFGRPVIASRVGGIPEVIEDGKNGLLVPPGDAPMLARAVERFFTTCDRAAMEEEVRKSVARYSWTEYAARLGTLIEETRP